VKLYEMYRKQLEEAIAQAEGTLLVKAHARDEEAFYIARLIVSLREQLEAFDTLYSRLVKEG
jgi:hypothetical protein